MPKKSKRYTTRMPQERGFSLIEIIIVVAITSMIVLVASGFQSNVDVLKEIVGQKLQSRVDVDAALQIIETEIRSAGPSGLGAYAIAAASTSSFSFYSDVDKDGVFELVRYVVGTSTLQKGVIKPVGSPPVYETSSEILTTFIANVAPSSTTSTFSYYDSAYTGSGAALAYPIDLGKIRVVQISFYADISPGKSPQPTFFSTTATVRNLRSN